MSSYPPPATGLEARERAQRDERLKTARNETDIANLLNSQTLDKILKVTDKKSPSKMTREEAIEWVSKTLAYKGGHYRKEPAETVPLEVLLAQIYIKAVRAYESKNDNKKADELKDLICYSVIGLTRLDLTKAPGGV